MGTGRRDILLQVRDEERLLYWYSLFENSKQGTLMSNNVNNSSSHLYSTGSSTQGMGTMMPLGNLSASGNVLQSRSESDQTLHGESLHVMGYSPSQPQPHQYQQYLHPLDRSPVPAEASDVTHQGPTIASPSSVTIQTLAVQEPQYLDSSQGFPSGDVESGAGSGQRQRDVEELELHERGDPSPWP